MPLLGLIRHGETEWNRLGKMQGHADIPLTEEAHQQLAQLAPPPALAGAQWFVSPLARARQTARLLGISDAIAEERLIETDWGDWQGYTTAQLREELGAKFLENEGKGRHFRPANGESPADVIERVQPFLAQIGARERPVGTVTHKGVIRAVFALAYDWDMMNKAPIKLTWQAAHLFDVAPDGAVRPVEMNVPLDCKS